MECSLVFTGPTIEQPHFSIQTHLTITTIFDMLFRPTYATVSLTFSFAVCYMDLVKYNGPITLCPYFIDNYCAIIIATILLLLLLLLLMEKDENILSVGQACILYRFDCILLQVRNKNLRMCVMLN